MHRLLSLTTYLSLALLAPSSAWASDAPVVASNPPGAQYAATVKKNGLIGEVIAETPRNGQGISLTINLNDNGSFNGDYYMYHIHDLPVPEDGNCTSTKKHLDPYGRGDETPCDAANPASCEVGDLSGKHGTIPSLAGFSTHYTDSYISLTPGTPAFLGNRSIVIHYPNKTRIACANFHLVERPHVTSNGTATGYGSGGYYGSGLSPTGTKSTGWFTSTSTARPRPIEFSNAGVENAPPRQYGLVLGPLIFGIAVAVW